MIRFSWWFSKQHFRHWILPTSNMMFFTSLSRMSLRNPTISLKFCLSEPTKNQTNSMILHFAVKRKVKEEKVLRMIEFRKNVSLPLNYLPKKWRKDRNVITWKISSKNNDKVNCERIQKFCINISSIAKGEDYKIRKEPSLYGFLRISIHR